MKGYAPCGGNIIYDLLLGDNKIWKQVSSSWIFNISALLEKNAIRVFLPYASHDHNLDFKRDINCFRKGLEVYT